MSVSELLTSQYKPWANLVVNSIAVGSSQLDLYEEQSVSGEWVSSALSSAIPATIKFVRVGNVVTMRPSSLVFSGSGSAGKVDLQLVGGGNPIPSSMLPAGPFQSIVNRSRSNAVYSSGLLVYTGSLLEFYSNANGDNFANTNALEIQETTYTWNI
jgi:hypothetical protein